MKSTIKFLCFCLYFCGVVLSAITIISCPQSSANKTDSKVTSDFVVPTRANFYLYGDTAAADADSTTVDVQTDLAIQEWTYSPSWDSTISYQVIYSGGADNSDQHLRLIGAGFSGRATGGWEAGGKAPLDLSRCDNLVFYAKSEAEAGSKISFAIESTDAGNNGVEQAITKDWAEYSLTMASLLAVQTAIDVKAVTTLKYVLASNKDVVYLDEVRFTGCDSKAVDNTPKTRFYLYGDAEDVDTDIFEVSEWISYDGYYDSITVVEGADGGADGSAKYRALTGTNNRLYAAGGWARKEGDTGSFMDISSCDSLVFSAKVPETDPDDATNTIATSVKWKLVDSYGHESEIEVATPSLTTAWQTYAIPLSTFSQTHIVFEQLTVIRYLLVQLTDQIHIDEVYMSDCTGVTVTPAQLAPDPLVPKRTDFYLHSDIATVDIDSAKEGVQVDLPPTWSHEWHNTKTMTVEKQKSGGAANSEEHYKLTYTKNSNGWAGNGWRSQGKDSIDLSTCNSLVFYAKSEQDTNTLNFAIESYLAYNDGIEVNITDVWKEYTLDITDLLAVTILPHTSFAITRPEFDIRELDVKKINAVWYLFENASGSTGVVYLDEVRFTGCDS